MDVETSRLIALVIEKFGLWGVAVFGSVAGLTLAGMGIALWKLKGLRTVVGHLVDGNGSGYQPSKPASDRLTDLNEPEAHMGQAEIGQRVTQVQAEQDRVAADASAGDSSMMLGQKELGRRMVRMEALQEHQSKDISEIRTSVVTMAGSVGRLEGVLGDVAVRLNGLHIVQEINAPCPPEGGGLVVPLKPGDSAGSGD